jgi:hypothetical protein
MKNILAIIDPDGAALAFEAVLPLLDAQAETRRSNTSFDKAILHAASTGRMIKQPEMRARFAGLPAGDFDQQHVDRLETVALAAWHVTVSLESASVQSSGARIAEADIEEGTRLKQRMIKVVEYHLGHVDEVSTELTAIRAGAGYLDMASDLVRLAALYQRHAGDLGADTRHYRAADRDRAGRLGHAIHQVLGDGRERDADYWSDYLARAWALLVVTYGEVSVAGRWLYRHENGDARFPSLYTVGRRRRGRPAGGDAGDGTARRTRSPSKSPR